MSATFIQAQGEIVPALRGRVASCLLAAIVVCVGGTAVAQDASSPHASHDVTEIRQVKLSFASLGAGAMELRGGQPVGAVSVGAGMDELIVAAKLRLRMTYSPAMLSELSHVRVILNGQVQAALPLPKAEAGREIEREVPLDPRYFSDFNEIRFDLVGHYTRECEDAQHSSLWATISEHSEIELRVRTLELRDDLALLPAPFFDRRKNSRLVLPIVLPDNPSRSMLRSAGIVASWFGALADYRGARFPPQQNSLPNRHALAFATNAARPSSLPVMDVESPTISVADHPEDPRIKILLIQGKDDAQLLKAVQGLVLGNGVLTGPSASISEVKYARRKAYETPRWIPSDRPVRLGELVDSADSLQVSGISPPLITVDLRLPPDLFTWNRTGIPLSLRYRHTMTSEGRNAQLRVSVNDRFLRSYPLEPDPASGLAAGQQRKDELLIPAFALGPDVQLQFQFALERQRTGLCNDVFTDTSRSAIDPNSTIDISSFHHYAVLPDLALFASSGYPYTRYADLAETAVVLPRNPTLESIEQLFFVLGRMGRHTGAAAIAYGLLDPMQARQARNVDLLILSGEDSNQLLAQWEQDLPLVISRRTRKFREPETAPIFSVGLARAEQVTSVPSEVNVSAAGQVAALVAFESPLSKDRSVVAFTGTDVDAAHALTDALEDVGKVRLIRGDLAIVRGRAVESYQGDSVYYVGDLPWWKWVWFHLSNRPSLLISLTLVFAVLLALWLYGWLQRRAAIRLGEAPRK